MNEDVKFVLKVIRNAFILAGLMFASTWATDSFTWVLCKPIIVFLLGYIFTELGIKYKVIQRGETNIKPMILSI